MTAAVVEPARGLLPPRSAEIAGLQAVATYPCVTVLCTTRVGERLHPDDANRLRQLIHEVAIRLRAELDPMQVQPVVDRLNDLFRDAADRPTSRAIALFVGGAVSRLHHLPLGVIDRVVVDPTFATRDLVQGLQRRPPYLLLVLGSTTARLLSVEPGMRKIAQYDASPRPRTGERSGNRDAKTRDDQRRGFLRLVDKRLAGELQRRPRPVVLAGVDRLTAEFTALTRNQRAMAGSTRGSHRQTPTNDLRALADSVLDTYLDAKESEVLERVDQAHRARRVAVGLDEVWLAARNQLPDMLAVEESLAVPARIGAGHDLLRAEDAAHPEVLDDAVDELVKIVIAAGGWVAFLRDGALSSFGGVVLALRT